ncbi:hypothetical protein [Sandarakinorhabdus sp.]|uniref:hypothetical protein n=1 Tax=Sandarakinorhabdus sp. TaxID=1916663 RepID=UPI0028AF263D|nr:hypothetical protein [Sandarakinorhabdus sp.]
MAMLLWPAVAAAQAPPPELVVNADAPVSVWINGLDVSLAVSTATIDHVTLNDTVAQRLGLSAAPPDNKGDLFIGGVVALQGRHGSAWLAHAQRLQRQQLYWFPGLSSLPLAGTIGPFSLPHERIRISWQSAADAQTSAPPSLALQLVGDIDHAAYGVGLMEGRLLLIGVDVRTRRALPLVSAASGADLAELLGGRLVGEPWQEEIVLGVKRPVRRLELDEPLEIGPIQIRAVAVRQGGPRDGTARLAPGQIIPFDAEEDPGIAQVRGRIVRKRGVARYIVLTRAQLEAYGCSSLLIDKPARLWELACTAPAAPPPPTQALPSSPVPTTPVAELVSDVLPPTAPLELALDAPLPVAIDGQAFALQLGDGGLAGLLLNRNAADRVAWRRLAPLGQADDLERWLQQQAGPGGGVASLPVLPPRVAGSRDQKVASGVTLTSLDVHLALGGRNGRIDATWLTRQLPLGSAVLNEQARDGTIALAALPVPRLRLRLATPPPAGTGGVLALPIADRSHDQSVMGVATLPGFDPLFVGLDLGTEQAEPIVSMALGHDLMRLHGGVYDGPAWRRRMADHRQRRLQRLQLATPLVIGPLRFDAVQVEMVPLLPDYLRTISGRRDPGGWPANRPWPDFKGVAGLERELRLTRTQLRAAGCHALTVDKPARSWTLDCSGGKGS